MDSTAPEIGDQMLSRTLQTDLKTIIGNVLLSPKNDELFIRIVERQPESDFESLKAEHVSAL